MSSWRRLACEPDLGRLYDLWCEEIILSGTSGRELFQPGHLENAAAQLGRIALLMLRQKADVVTEAAMEAEGLPVKELTLLTRNRFSILVRQTQDEWGFAHDSLREFALARLFASELRSQEFRMLTETDSLDYFGAEIYQFLEDLLPSHDLWENIAAVLGRPLDDSVRWSNLVRNCFEAIGMIGEDSAGRFIPVALDLLGSSEQPSTRLSARSRYNIVRCLERLHESAPRPYYRHVFHRDWARTPSMSCFGAAAVRGFHQNPPRIGFFPPMEDRLGPNGSSSPHQSDVSRCLFDVMERCLAGGDSAHELVVNCSFALIRWLHRDHLDRLKSFLAHHAVCPQTRGNLFHAVLRFREPALLEGYSDLFAGMHLSWVHLHHWQLPPDFVLKNVRIERAADSDLDLPESRRSNCVLVP